MPNACDARSLFDGGGGRSDDGALAIMKFEVGVPAFVYASGQFIKADTHRPPSGNALGDVVRCTGPGCPLCGVFKTEVAIVVPVFDLVSGAPGVIKSTAKRRDGADGKLTRSKKGLLAQLTPLLSEASSTAVFEVLKKDQYSFQVTARPDLAGKVKPTMDMPALIARLTAEADDLFDGYAPQFTNEEILADPVIKTFLEYRRGP